ncbi:hypothetical protein [Streptomyces sp. 7N604]
MGGVTASWVVEGVVDEGGFGVLGGEPGVGKTVEVEVRDVAEEML